MSCVYLTPLQHPASLPAFTYPNGTGDDEDGARLSCHAVVVADYAVPRNRFRRHVGVASDWKVSRFSDYHAQKNGCVEDVELEEHQSFEESAEETVPDDEVFSHLQLMLVLLKHGLIRNSRRSSVGLLQGLKKSIYTYKDP